MLTSMTGFGRAEAALPPAGRAIVEIHSLNHKFLEIECRLPEGFQGLEDSIRAMVSREAARGRIRLSVVVKAKPTAPPVAFQPAVARQYLRQLRTLQRQLKVPGEIRMETLLGLPQVIVSVKEEQLPERWIPVLKESVAQAVSRMTQMRRREGRHLFRVMKGLLGQMKRLYRKVRGRVPAATGELEKRLAARIRQLAPGADPRMAVAEAASLAQATDVSEELARIESHLKALEMAVGGGERSPGRTIDFLAQELHREVNTLGSKMRDSAIVQWVVAMKGQIEKLREQAANVE